MAKFAPSCERYAIEFPAIAGEGESPSYALSRHLDSCPTCRAELARYRGLLQMLSELRVESERLPFGLLSDVIEHLSRAAERRVLRDILARRRSVFLLVLGVALVAVSVPVGLVRTRARASMASARSRPAE